MVQGFLRLRIVLRSMFDRFHKIQVVEVAIVVGIC